MMLYGGVSVSHFSTEVWSGGKTFTLPAAVTTWRADLIGEVGLFEHLAVGLQLPFVYGDAREVSATNCAWGGMCDDVLGLGDVALAAISSWDLGSVRVAGRAELASGLGYRHGIDDLAAPGDGNTDLRLGPAIDWWRSLGVVGVGLSAGAGYELALGVPGDAWYVGGGPELRWRYLECAATMSHYDTLSGTDFAEATTAPDFPDDPLRFVDLRNRTTELYLRLSAFTNPVALHLGGRLTLAANNGPRDLRGLSLGLSWVD